MSQAGRVVERSVVFNSESTIIPLSPKQNEINLGSAAKGAEAKQKSPGLKLRQPPRLDLSGSNPHSDHRDPSARQNDVMAVHTPPVTKTRQANVKVPSSSSDDPAKTGALNSPRKRNMAADSPRNQNITPRRHDQQASADAPKTTPRGANQGAQSESSRLTPRETDQEKSASPRDVQSREIRKKISRKFSRKLNDLKLNLSALPEKIAPNVSSSRLSPSSAGRVSPGKLTPTKKPNNLFKDVPVDIRNQLAKAYAAMKKDSLYMNSGETRRSMMLNAKMIGILSENKIAFDTKKLQALADDAELRSQYSEIDIEIDLTKAPYPDLVKEGSKKFITRWESDNSDKGQKFKDLPADQRELIDQHFMPTFIADYFRAGVSHELQMPDGTGKAFASPIELAKYLNQGASDESRSRYISNVTSQNIVNLLQQLTCGGLPDTTSPIKLFDGTPLIPRGRVEQRFMYQLEKDSTVVVKVQVTISADNLGNARRESQVQNTRRDPVAIDDDAKLQIDTTLRFKPNGEWTIYNPHLVASGWNLPATQ